MIKFILWLLHQLFLLFLHQLFYFFTILSLIVVINILLGSVILAFIYKEMIEEDDSNSLNMKCFYTFIYFYLMIMIKQKSISKEDEITTVKNLSFIHSVTLNII